MTHKYQALEIERRWQVDPSRLPALSSYPSVEITDIYLTGRLRLRHMRHAEENVYKLCKKYGKVSSLSEPITNLYLSAEEYKHLAEPGGDRLVRVRYYYAYQGVQLAINVPQINTLPTLAECEFASEAAARAFVPPGFCGEEVTERVAYEGRTLAREASRSKV